MNAAKIATALGGNESGRNVVAPGPGHSRADRSLSIKLDPSFPDGSLTYSFAGDQPPPNASNRQPKDRTAAERQRRYRQRKRDGIVTPPG